MSYQDIPLPPDFQPRKYAPTDEYQPVDPFDIPTNQKRLAQPTPLRPYNGFVLLAFWLGLLAVMITGFAFIIPAATHAVLFPLAWVAAALLGFMWGIPGFISALIGMYQLSFTGFEKGRAFAWMGLILNLVSIMTALLGLALIIHGLIGAGQTVEKIQAALGDLTSLTNTTR